MEELVTPLLNILNQLQADYTLFFRHVSNFSCQEFLTKKTNFSWLESTDISMSRLLQSDALQNWFISYANKLKTQTLSDSERIIKMKSINPLYIPRNYLLQKVIDEAEKGDVQPLKVFFKLLQKPFEEGSQSDRLEWAQPAPSWAKDMKCSCSS
jgi:uncharacterized protein YdiU (UPF0061 family)